MDPLRFWKRLAAFFDRFADHVEGVIILQTNRARRIEQQGPFVATELESALAAPIRTAKLLIEVGKLTVLYKLRTHRPLLGRATPKVDLFYHKTRVSP